MTTVHIMSCKFFAFIVNADILDLAAHKNDYRVEFCVDPAHIFHVCRHL